LKICFNPQEQSLHKIQCSDCPVQVRIGGVTKLFVNEPFCNRKTCFIPNDVIDHWILITLFPIKEQDMMYKYKRKSKSYTNSINNSYLILQQPRIFVLCVWQYRACQTGTLPHQPFCQPLFVLVFFCCCWRWGLMNYLPRLASNHDLLDLCFLSS
jgi:hypothetical protein